MGVHRASFLVLLIVLGTFLLVRKVENADAKHCTRNCDPRIDHAICARSEKNRINPICTNCCAGMKGCNYYSADRTFICEGETEVGKPRGCPRNCDPRIDHAICARSEEKKTNQLCTNCCAGMKGCNYYSADGIFICEGETEVGKPRGCPRNCDPRIDHAICPRSEEKKTNQICTNCCAGMKGCNYYSADGIFICEGETEVGKPRGCPRNCDPRIDHAICPRSEEKKTNQICTNCCAGMKGCNYYSADGIFICEGETEVGKPRGCPRNCDPRIDHAICPRSEEKKTNQICTNCCAGMKGCNYYSADGTFICEGETEVGKPRGCPRNCDPRIAYGFCLRSEETKINKICTNCCAGKNSCNYFSSNGTFICKGESGVKTIEEVELPKPCTLECDPGVAYMTCPLLGLAKLKQVCVNCCTAGDGCKLYGHDGSLISCPKEL
ncbi:hypothetical protein K7X08_025773 [Anisodus acutangulus]|uniref:Trypsin proteinase inhibitor n=1 Tax=Anisodus acutangulus TaxID=402998 RepID=A0A9Q1QZ76_9SOLA|nr:hypothetical protein K7X08_025773 [Anisodus acutangulus]